MKYWLGEFKVKATESRTAWRFSYGLDKGEYCAHKLNRIDVDHIRNLSFFSPQQLNEMLLFLSEMKRH